MIDINKLKDPMFREIFKFSLPIIADQAFLCLLSIANLIMCGVLGADVVAAIGLGDSLSSTANQLFIALSIGGTVLVAQSIGSGDKDLATEYGRQAIISGTVFATVISIVLIIFRRGVMNLLFGKVDPVVMGLTIQYFSICVLYFPLIFFTLQGYGIMRAAGDSETPMRINIISTLTSLALAFIFINLLNFGVVGAGLSLLISRIVGAVLVLIALSDHRRTINMKLSPFTYRANFLMLKKIYGISIPTSTESLVFMCGRLLSQAFVAQISTVAISINTIANASTNILNVPGNAFQSVVTTVVGRYVGKGDPDDVKKCLSVSMTISRTMIIVASILFIIFRKPICWLFIKDPAIIESTSQVVLSCAIMMIFFWADSFVLPNAFRGAGDVKYSLVVAISSMWIVRIGTGYVLGIVMEMGVMGIWCAMYLDWIVRMIFFVIHRKSDKWLIPSGLKSR